MDTYIYQAALLCENCASKIITQLTKEGKAPNDPNDEESYDSDDYPKGPYPDGGGEADCPQYCDQCQEYLENPLTSEGIEYIRQEYIECIVDGANGIYVPKVFSEKYPQYLTENQINDLSNPDNEFYWDTWEDVLNEVKLKDDEGKDEYALQQDGDLFAVRCDLPDVLQEQLNESW